MDELQLKVSKFCNRNVPSIKRTKNDKKIHKNLLCCENYHKYMEKTTLHGLKYVGNRSLSMIER